MRNFKDIIIEKLKISSKNTVKLPDLEDFETIIYDFCNAHEIAFEDIDSKYKVLKNCPKYENNGTIYYVVSLYVSKRMNSDKWLYAFCYKDESSTINNFMINSMDHLIEVLGEELVLQIWDYIR